VEKRSSPARFATDRRSKLAPITLALGFVYFSLLAGFLTGPAARAALPDGSSPASRPGLPFAIADFDGDSRPDLATVETGLIGAAHARYWIGFRMSAGARQMIGVNGPVGGLEIATRDVNGDNFIDLVVSAAWLKSPIAVLVNDGHGNFSVRDPAAFSAALTNPSHTLESPSRRDPEFAIVASSRGASDLVANERTASGGEDSEEFLSSDSLRADFPLLVCSSGRAPPLSVHHV